jgi:hypothetical protein
MYLHTHEVSSFFFNSLLFLVLEKIGIGSILDYAAEEDLAEKEAETEQHLGNAPRAKGVISARTFLYESEENCEANKQIFFRCIEHVSEASPNAFAAIKIT